MAEVVGVFNVAHSPFCYTPGERWNEIRATRKLRMPTRRPDDCTLSASGQLDRGGRLHISLLARR